MEKVDLDVYGKEISASDNVAHAMMDLEMATRNALMTRFPQCEISLCYFHLQQAHYHWISTKNILKNGALAFLPPYQVLDGRELVLAESDTLDIDLEDKQKLDLFSVYFEGSFIGRLRNNGQRSAPRHPINFWKQYQNVRDSNSRSNNGIEGFHFSPQNMANM